MATLTIQAAAHRLGIAEITIRRKLRSGQIPGHQEDPPSRRWWVDIPDDQLPSPSPGAGPRDGTPQAVTEDGHGFKELIAVLKREVSSMQHHLETREREVRELHVIIQQQALALPSANVGNRGWWRRMWPVG